ncbi:Fc receptor-like protein 3, partial [Melozone crissalis]|uniref:Fc receptor-like protein 3 n=1 Tax=Melozone crissalis TaxID=40204 RepID=UPI0023DC7090
MLLLWEQDVCCHGNRGCGFPGNRKGALFAAVQCGDVTRVGSHRVAGQNSHQPRERWPQQRVTASAHGWGHRDGREAQTLGLTGAQTTQLLLDSPWRPAVLWDWVTLTCKGSGTAGATTWYKDGKHWWQKGPDHFTVTESGTYECDRPGSGRSGPVTVSDDWLVLQVPVRVLLERDTVTLRCRGWKNSKVTSVSFYREGTELRGLRDGTELSLSPLQLSHSGSYSCRGWVEYWTSEKLWRSVPVTVTVHLFSVPELQGPPEITVGSPLTLSCRSTPSPLRPSAPLLYRFYRDGWVVGGPQGSPQLLLPAVGVSHSGNYSCEVQTQGGTVRKSSARLRVTVRRVPVANATITPGPLSHQVHTGDNVTLRCSVQVGSAPVTFPGTGVTVWVLPGIAESGTGGEGTWHKSAQTTRLLVDSPWRPAVLWDEVTLTCKGSGTAGATTWYKDGKHWWQKGPDHFTVTESGTYECYRPGSGRSGPVTVSDELFTVPVLVLQGPPEITANATITPGALAHQVHTGDNVTLRCSVQVGSAPVTFTWLHNGQEVARGPLLELRDIDVGHSGTWQCVATNQLGQDGHHVFRALSPELALEV